ncbi:hypothetical protein D3C76_1196450 [compost metagenome]
MGLHQAPEIIQLAFSGGGPGAENLPKAADQAFPGERPPQQPPQRAEQEFLGPDRAVGFREQAAIEKDTTDEVDARFVMPRQQLLGHAVAVIVGQHMQRAPHIQVREQGLLQIGLLQQAVDVIRRFGGVAETEHVTRDHPVALRQRLPQVMPIPTGGGKTVDQQQRLALPGHPVTDGMTTEHEDLAALAPDTQGNLGQGHQLLYPASC